jgi:DNA-binding NarL/FixJ family response regulator
MLKLLIADDHPLYREALIGALQPRFKSVNFVESDSFSTTINAIRRQRNVSLVLLDLNMPGCDNFYGLLRIRHNFADLPIIVVSATDDAETVSQVMEFGANGFIPKTTITDDIVSAVNDVLEGKTWLPPGMAAKIDEVNKETVAISQCVKELTPKQFQVLRLVKKGMSNKAIAEHLDVTEATIKAHVSMLFKRLNVKSRTQILVAIEKLQLD